ncbi:MAG: alkaline phosphatase D family protein [Pseudomonadota bacterium]|nr:alkaline phosphatase D family protein [Pseudomonadota bacterium]
MRDIAYARYQFSRRRLLRGFGASAIAALSIPLLSRPALAQPIFTKYPFQLGVASGDPLADGFVIWTRLAPDPMKIGHGMPSQPVEVAWEVASDARFEAIASKGVAIARPELGHSVHVEVSGLEPARPYWYRFQAGTERSLTGRAKTLPRAGARTDHVRFGVAGCQHYEQGLFTAHRKLAAEELDFIFCYGDYIYEGRGNRVWNGPNGPVENVRQHAHQEIYSLDDYRRRYAQYKMDADLQAAHASAPWFAVWDDHETDNNWVTDVDQDGTPKQVFDLRRQAAVQAYYENMPLRPSAFPIGPAMQLFRGAAYGDLIDLSFLDTRQYRSDQPCADQWGVACDTLGRADAEVLGTRQEAWVVDRLSSSTARWNVLAQQVMMMDLDRDPGPEHVVNHDSWAGYRAPRNRLLAGIERRRTNNVIVLTGDEHQNYAGELHLDGRAPGPRPIATEFVTTSITSGGDGIEQRPDMAAIQAVNSQLKFNNAQRGYLVCDVTPERWMSEFKVLDRVTARDGVLRTRIKLAVESGDPRLVAA